MIDWHSDPLQRDLPLDANFRIKQNVRRFLTAELGAKPTLGRPFHQWLASAKPETLGDVVDQLSQG